VFACYQPRLPRHLCAGAMAYIASGPSLSILPDAWRDIVAGNSRTDTATQSLARGARNVQPSPPDLTPAQCHRKWVTVVRRLEEALSVLDELREAGTGSAIHTQAALDQAKKELRARHGRNAKPGPVRRSSLFVRLHDGNQALTRSMSPPANSMVLGNVRNRFNRAILGRRPR
jgi:hypothetical protein